MVKALQSYWNFGSTFCAIECTTKDGSLNVRAVTAKRRKNEFVDIRQESADSFEILSAKIPKGQHSVLVINTDKVLVKTVSKIESAYNAVTNAFPGIDLNEFYYEVCEGSHAYFVSIIKRKEVDELIRKATASKIQIIGFRIGFGVIHDIIPLINQHEIIASGKIFEIENGKISGFERTADTTQIYSIEDITVDANHLISLAGLFGYINQETQNSNIEEDNSLYRGNYLEKNFFQKGLKVGIGLLLFLALINFFFFSSYRSEFSKLSHELEVSKSQTEVYKKRKQAVEAKEKRVSNILRSGNSKASFYINRLISGKPKSILFDQITYQPLFKSIRPDKPIEVNPNVLIISGESSDKNAFSTWIKGIESFDWVENVTPTEYGENGSSEKFSLNLKITDDASE